MPEGGLEQQVPLYSAKELAANQYAHTEPLTTRVEELFDWDKELHELATVYGREFYLVVFRSIRKDTADSKKLYAADADAQEEARLSGGLLKVLLKPKTLPPTPPFLFPFRQ